MIIFWRNKKLLSKLMWQPFCRVLTGFNIVVCGLFCEYVYVFSFLYVVRMRVYKSVQIQSFYLFAKYFGTPILRAIRSDTSHSTAYEFIGHNPDKSLTVTAAVGTNHWSDWSLKFGFLRKYGVTEQFFILHCRYLLYKDYGFFKVLCPTLVSKKYSL